VPSTNVELRRDLEQRGSHLAFLLALQTTILDSNRRLLHEQAHEDDRKGRQDADPQHAPPAE